MGDVCMNLAGDKMMMIRSWNAIKNGEEYLCPSYLDVFGLCHILEFSK